MTRPGQTYLEEAFVKINFEEEGGPTISREGDSKAYNGWVGKASANFPKPNLIGADLLRKLYPKHSLVMSQDYNLDMLGFPLAATIPLEPDELITNSFFYPLARNSGGVIVDSVEFGGFRTAWDKYEFTIFIVKYPEGLGQYTQHYILHEGPKGPAQSFLKVVGTWAFELHNEIWVFNNGFWNKDASLWIDVQKANWNDVILKDEFKKSLQDDVYSFFDSERLYKDLGIPWKRGLILYGPPGNGKTISLKAIMKTVQQKGHNPLYVKSFQSWRGEEGSMDEVFAKARILAPCVLILEDLDSLINDRNRSFFLNQLDGIQGNDGLLLIATTNHFDRLDPGLSERPSRFDRKYIFDDPDRDERLLYAKYWQNKLTNNDKVDFPDRLALEIADVTYGFSFAYLKESFVSTLVLLVRDDQKKTFEEVIKGQIKQLRKQLEKVPKLFGVAGVGGSVGGGGVSRCVEVISGSQGPLPAKPDIWEIMRERVAYSLGGSAGHSLTY